MCKTFFFFSFLTMAMLVTGCQTNESSTGQHYDSITVAPATTTQNSSATISAELGGKATEAFALVQDYARKSKVLDREFASRYVFCFSGTGFSVGEIRADTKLEVNPVKITGNDLNLVFSEFETWYGVTKKTTQDKVVVFLDSNFVKRESAIVVGSVILHELAHMGMIANNMLQGVGQELDNEKLAYNMQKLYLIYSFSGPDAEITSAQGLPVELSAPPADMEFFKFVEESTLHPFVDVR